MGSKTNIEWCHYTFNPWIGCTKVHQGCTHCFAEADQDKRRGRVKWGPNGTRSKTSADYWKQPLKWNREAAAGFLLCPQCQKLWPDTYDASCCDCGYEIDQMEATPKRPRVFCASLADVFEDW